MDVFQFFYFLTLRKPRCWLLAALCHQHLFNNTTQSDSAKEMSVLYLIQHSLFKCTLRIWCELRGGFFTLAVSRRSIPASIADIIIHACVMSRLDYCNVLPFVPLMFIIKSLQFVQNATARLLTRTRKYDHISWGIGPFLTLTKNAQI